VDDPLRWLLADPRRLRATAVIDHLWVRVIDVVGALGARGYGIDERLVLDIVGDDPATAGRFTLDTGATSGACRPAKRWEKTDLVLGLADLGAIYLGGVRPTTLAAAGRVNEVRPGALHVADQVFASPTAPFCTIGF
jgi:predicted acetyltransferase